MEVNYSDTLRDFIDRLKNELRLLNPSIYSTKGILYTPKPANIEAQHRYKLEKTFRYVRMERRKILKV